MTNVTETLKNELIRVEFERLQIQKAMTLLDEIFGTQSAPETPMPRTKRIRDTTRKARVLQYLLESSAPKAAVDIHDAVSKNECPYQTTLSAIKRLTKQGLLRRVDRGLYVATTEGAMTATAGMV